MKNNYYFAHSKKIYDTVLEAEIKHSLRQMGYDIICPNKDMGELGSIWPYLQRINKLDGTIALEYKGFVGKGVYEEVKYTLLSKKPCYVFRDGKLFIVDEVQLYNTSDWKFQYGKIIAEFALEPIHFIY